MKPVLEQRLAKVVHPSLISFHHSFIADFQNSMAAFACHSFCPNAVTIENKFGLDPRPYAVSQPQLASEEFLWCVLIQVLGALNAIHTANFASKVR